MTKHIVVVGAGPAGYVGALHAAGAGARVTLVGSHDTGGTCLRRGCIPTKTLVASCDTLHRFQRAERFGILVDGDVRADWSRLRARMDEVTRPIITGVEKLLDNRRVELVSGRAHLLDAHTVEMEDGRRIQGDNVLICAGSRPARPSIFPFDGHTVVTSDEALQWQSLPNSLAIVGGGVIASEFAFIFQALGVSVTVLEAADRPLPAEDTEVSTLIGREMRKRKIRFKGSTMINQVAFESSEIACYQDGEAVARAERLLVATGREPNTGNLNLQAVGIDTGPRGEILVDQYMRTAVPGVYAAGDITCQLQLAHAASAQARLAVEHMLGRDPEPLQVNHIPRVTFTHPEVASVGLTEEQAEQSGFATACGRFDLRGLGMAHALDELAGMVKVVGERDTGRLLGAHIVGAHAGEMIHEATLVLSRGGKVEELYQAVHAHPTLSESVGEAAEDVFHQPPHKLLKTKTTEDEPDALPG